MSGETMVRRRGTTSPLADRDTATTLPDGRHPTSATSSPSPAKVDSA